MKYLVMECGLSYAVVLDSSGHFLKVPNLGYEVGQQLDHVVLQDTPEQGVKRRREITRWIAVAACLCLMTVGSWGVWRWPVGTVRMQINPDVQMSVNHFDRIVSLEGLNEDGRDLIDGYRFYGKVMETVSDEVADRAMEIGYLKEGGQIALTVESDRKNWKAAAEEKLILELEVHFENRIVVVTDSSDSEEKKAEQPEIIVIEPEKILQEQKAVDDSQADVPQTDHSQNVQEKKNTQSSETDQADDDTDGHDDTDDRDDDMDGQDGRDDRDDDDDDMDDQDDADDRDDDMDDHDDADDRDDDMDDQDGRDDRDSDDDDTDGHDDRDEWEDDETDQTEDGQDSEDDDEADDEEDEEDEDDDEDSEDEN